MNWKKNMQNKELKQKLFLESQDSRNKSKMANTYHLQFHISMVSSKEKEYTLPSGRTVRCDRLTWKALCFFIEHMIYADVRVGDDVPYIDIPPFLVRPVIFLPPDTYVVVHTYEDISRYCEEMKKVWNEIAEKKELYIIATDGQDFRKFHWNVKLERLLLSLALE